MMKFKIKKWCASIFLLKALFIFPSLALAHLISITPVTPFYNTILASTTSIAVYKVTNISNIPLDGIEDQSILPSSMRLLSSSTCSASAPLAIGASCTLSISLTAPSSATQITGAQLRERAVPSLDGVVYVIPSVTVGTQLLWTWVSGNNATNQQGTCGTQGSAASENVPGARGASVSWIDKNNNLWLFGGNGIDCHNNQGRLNDLWKFDVTTTNWTWMNGSDSVGAFGTSAGPGARQGSISWIDSHGNLWLFGGYGNDSIGNQGHLNDLWKFNGTNWTLVSGVDTINQSGVYGTIGQAASGNVPGSRRYSVSWIDSSDHLWLFGGYGCDVTTTCTINTQGLLNDLWMFNGTNWTWVSGASQVNAVGVYDSPGQNVPGARVNSVTWADHNGILWLFSGYGYSNTTTGYLNDLWKFDGTNWTWVSGSKQTNQSGSYGTQGTSSSSNMPGSRVNAISWLDNSNNLWLFGGYGYDGTSGSLYNLNDLWKFDGTNWTWVSGLNTGGQIGTYGQQGTPTRDNIPGARGNTIASISWIDTNGNLWFFGGNGLGTSTTVGDLNDLWKLSIN